ncbi:AraC-like ligand-binding domain-containing protein [Streptomyces griseoluteus]|uniref:AraC-like ligand-binding domain-containing protein n=1 Tax=Streptomyces griseoluteus TaxID=29306 RepID=UPI00367B021C
MTITEFGTVDVARDERFAKWCDLTADTLVPSMLRSDHEDDFRASLRVVDLGTVQVSALIYPSLVTSRPARLIRKSDPEGLQMMLNLHGGHRMIHGGRDATSTTGEILLYDTSQPWDGWAHADPGPVQGIHLQLPRTLLPLKANRLRSLIARPLSGTEGVGALLAGYLRQIIADTHSYTPADGSRLASVAVDLLTAVCAHQLDAEAALPPETHRRALLMRVRAFIDRHLADPGLTPATVAAGCQISLRHLHRLFGEEDLTVAAWIRQRRLDRCRRELADPDSVQPISAIATRWGFSDPAHFSRVFRKTHGMSPSDYQHGARSGTGHTQPIV